MLYLPVYKVVPGSQGVSVARGAWNQDRTFREGTYLICVETTALYWAIQESKAPDAIAGDGMVLPRDDSMIIVLGQNDNFYWWLPNNGTMRWVELEQVNYGVIGK